MWLHSLEPHPEISTSTHAVGSKACSFDLFQRMHKMIQIITVITNNLLSGYWTSWGNAEKNLSEWSSFTCSLFIQLVNSEITRRELCGRTLLTFNTLQVSFLTSELTIKSEDSSLTAKYYTIHSTKMSCHEYESRFFSIKVGTDDWHPCFLSLAYNRFVLKFERIAGIYQGKRWCSKSWL